MWRGLLTVLAWSQRGAGCQGILLWLERPLGQDLEDLFERQLGLGRAEIQPEQAALAGSSPVDGRSAAPPGRCCTSRGSTRLCDFSLLDSAH